MHYAIIDIETTGGNYNNGAITEIAIFLHDGNKIIDSFSSLVNPEMPIPPFVSKLTGITDEMVSDAPKFYEIAQKVVEITQNAVFVAHNVQFDYGFIRHAYKSLGYDYHRPKLCTLQLAQKHIPQLNTYNLGSLCKHFNIVIEKRHRATGDALATVSLFEQLQKIAPQYIEHKINGKIVPNATQTPQLSSKDFELLTEEVGLLYLHNSENEVIYVEFSPDIKQRAQELLINAPNSEKRRQLQLATAAISHVYTGSELIGLLLKQHEQINLNPLFNNQISLDKFGIFIEEKATKSYLWYDKIKNRADEPIQTFVRRADAMNWIQKKFKQYGLCKSLVKNIKLPNCPRHNGAICEQNAHAIQNAKLSQLMLHQMLKAQRTNLFSGYLIEEGRNLSEQAFVQIRDGKFVAYGYFDKNAAPSAQELENYSIFNKKILQSEKLIEKYLKKRKNYTKVPEYV
ncbi:MAG: 3'-5' exonuclease [Chitinophagales bacterium]|nr:hypothetical protein [Bacteroidota bacterium]MCB9042180.1 hypothetical protein [Chitinophagales bacterium]